jgi:putative copper export protein
VFLATDLLVLSLRALSFVAIFQAAGAVIFLALFGSSIEASTADRIRGVARITAVAALCLAVLHYVLTPARMAGSFGSTFDPSLESLLLRSSSGGAHIMRVVGLALLVLSLDRASRVNTIGGVAGAALALASFALMGHTVIHPLRWLLAPLLLAHVGVVAFWFGALWPLRLVAAVEPAERAGAIVARFSARATWLVPLILVCGALMTVVFVRSFDELLTPYGAMVAGKTLGFGVLLGLASLNKWRYGPRMLVGDREAAAALGRTALVEWGMLAAILIATAVMTALYAPEHLEGSFAPEHGAEPEHPARD